jgi:hypothetical protein
MKLLKCKSILSLVLAIGLLASTMPLFADTMTAAPTPQQRQQWRKTHPARTKDNARIRNQKRMLRADLKSGKITKTQYDASMKDLNTIKKEEVTDAKANDNGGHLTGGQQQAINQQLNENRKDINQDVNAGQNTH